MFGSVAGEEADTQSDIDLFVLIACDQTTTRRRLTDLVADLETTRFNDDRFALEPYVESAESANRADSKLAALFAEGITVYGTNQLQAVRETVMTGE